MRSAFRTVKLVPSSGAMLAVALVGLGLWAMPGGLWAMPGAQAERHEAAFRGHAYREHAFHEHEFHDRRYLDGRYHHDHYYPPPGFVFGALPPGYFAVGFHGIDLYFGAGVWYRGYAPGRFVVVAPPPGVVVPVLPPFYTTVWVGGVPYYYANNVYYVQAPQGYMVAAPPPPNLVVEQPPAAAPPPYVEQPAQTPPPSPPSAGAQAPAPGALVFAYPERGQSAEQQAKDRYECGRWAVSETGFDPGKAASAGAAAVQTDNYRRAMSACLEARGYSAK